MKFILEIKNYDCNRLYVNTDTMKFALDTHEYDKNYDNSNINEFKKEFYDWASSYPPSLLLQRKTDFYDFVEELKKNGYEEIEAKPLSNDEVLEEQNDLDIEEEYLDELS